MMDNDKIVGFICELRKSKNMTQKQLAEKLNMTDKAVSKWERGLGYPDITALSPLADILGVTINELLSGEKDEKLIPKADDIIKNTLQYADKVTAGHKVTISNMVKAIISFVFLLAIFICVICDFAVTKTFSWSIYPVSSLIFAWTIIIPLIHFKKHKYTISLVSISVLTIPFLYIIEQSCGVTGWVLTIGIPTSLIALAYLWIVCCLYTYTKINKWFVSSIAMFLGLILSVGINYIIAKAILEPIIDVWDIFSSFIIIIVAIVFLIIGYISKKKVFN